MAWRCLSRVCLALFALAMALALHANVETASAQSGETVTTELQPGLNLAGWTEPEAPVKAIFEAIPALEAVYAWDAENQRYRLAIRAHSGFLGDLETLTPGTGLWLRLGGDAPFTWTHPLVPEAGPVFLHEGWNLVVWAGEDRVPPNEALQFLRDALESVTDAGGREPAALTTGGTFWLRVSASREWVQGYERPRVEFIGQFSRQEKADRETLLDGVVAFYVRHFGVAVPDLAVRFGDAEADMTCAGYAARVVYLREPCTGAIAHEYGHALQEYLATREESGQWGVLVTRNPRWLDEGVANHWSALFKAESGVRDYEEYISTVIQNVRKFEAPLQSFEKVLQDGLHYNLASLATDSLVGLSNQEALLEYYKSRPNRESWQDNFFDVFGIHTGEFYNLFEERRVSIAPPLPRFRGVVLDSDGEPAVGLRVFIARLSSGVSSTVSTSSTGSFDTWAPDGFDAHLLSLDYLPGDGSTCHLGWYDGVGGVTTVYTQRLEPFPGGPDITIRLPGPPSELCQSIYGIVLGADGKPVEGLWIAIHGHGASSGTNIGGTTASDGTFAIGARDGTYAVSVFSDRVDACSLHGYEGMLADGDIIQVAGRDLAGIRLEVAEARRANSSWTVCTVVS